MIQYLAGSLARFPGAGWGGAALLLPYIVLMIQKRRVKKESSLTNGHPYSSTAECFIFSKFPAHTLKVLLERA